MPDYETEFIFSYNTLLVIHYLEFYTELDFSTRYIKKNHLHSTYVFGFVHAPDDIKLVIVCLIYFTYSFWKRDAK